MKTNKLTLIASLLSLALIIFTIEAQIPPLAPIPGIKLGLANVITLVTVYILSRKEAFTILILRVILCSIFSGNIQGFIYSFAGGLVSFALIAVLSKLLSEDKIWVVSVFGAIGHNIGQIAVACIITGLIQMLWYLPALMISGVITGFFTGKVAQLTLKQLNKHRIFLKEEQL